MTDLSVSSDFNVRLKSFIRKNEGIDLGLVLNQLEPDYQVGGLYKVLADKGELPVLSLFAPKFLAKMRVNMKWGQMAFIMGNNFGAVRYFSYALQLSQPNTPETWLAYSYRSAALFRMNRFHECLLDVHRALRGNLILSQKVPLFERKRKCLEKLQMSNDLKVPSENRASSSDKSQCPIGDNINEADNTNAIDDARFELPSLDSPHDWIPDFSKKVNVDFSTEYGRHMIAVEDIDPGEIIFIDKPYASVLTNNFHLLNCSHCHVMCLALIPCANNCSLMFCSDTCMKEAFEQYHRIECQIMYKLIAIRADLQMKLAVRILLVATGQGKYLKLLLRHRLYQCPFDAVIGPFTRKHFEDNYYHVHHLESHHNDIKSSDVLENSFKAAYLVHVLKFSTYFSKFTDEKRIFTDLSEEELFVATLLLKFLYISKFNSCATKERVEKPTYTKTDLFIPFYELLQTGRALYSKFSLLNHSCDPNTMLINYKTTAVCYATQYIQKGEQIFMSYLNSNYAMKPKLERSQHLMENYLFDCKCTACLEDWPLLNDCKHDFKIILCGIKTKEATFIIKKLEKIQSNIIRRENDTLQSKTFIFIRDTLIKLRKHSKLPHRSYLEALGILITILTSKGNSYGLDGDTVLCNNQYYKPELPILPF